jgi:hypothetical protein
MSASGLLFPSVLRCLDLGLPVTSCLVHGQHCTCSPAVTTGALYCPAPQLHPNCSESLPVTSLPVLQLLCTRLVSERLPSTCPDSALFSPREGGLQNVLVAGDWVVPVCYLDFLAECVSSYKVRKPIPLVCVLLIFLLYCCTRGDIYKSSYNIS